MLAELKELYRFRELLWILILRDLKVRYKNSVLGFAWSLINPVIQVAVISVVVKYVMQVQVPNLSAYIFCAFLPWSFFQLALMDTSHSLIINDRLMKKVYFPREIIPLSLILSNLIHLLLAIFIFLLYLVLWVGRDGHPSLALLHPKLAFVPLMIFVELLLVTGISLIISGFSVFYEDVKHLMVALLQVFYFAVPVMYFAEQVKVALAHRGVPHWLYDLYMFNPLVTIITAFRAWMLDPILIPMRSLTGSIFYISTSSQVPLTYLLFTAAISIGIAIGGYSLFNRMKWSFVERP